MYILFHNKQKSLDETVIGLQLKAQVQYQQVQEIQTKSNNL